MHAGGGSKAGKGSTHTLLKHSETLREGDRQTDRQTYRCKINKRIIKKMDLCLELVNSQRHWDVHKRHKMNSLKNKCLINANQNMHELVQFNLAKKSSHLLIIFFIKRITKLFLLHECQKCVNSTVTIWATVCGHLTIKYICACWSVYFTVGPSFAFIKNTHFSGEA